METSIAQNNFTLSKEDDEYIKKSLNEKILVHRSISAEEFHAIFSNEYVHGKYDILNNPNVKLVPGVVESNVYDFLNHSVCFYYDDFHWFDKQHSYEMLLNIPMGRLVSGKGIYHVSDRVKHRQIWSGHAGPNIVEVQEYYAPYYSYKDIIGFSGNVKNIASRDELVTIIQNYIKFFSINSTDFCLRKSPENTYTKFLYNCYRIDKKNIKFFGYYGVNKKF